MNNGSQGQPAQGQPSGPQQQQRQPRPLQIFRAEHIKNLPDNFSAAEKAKWETGLRKLWAQMEQNPAESAIHQEAKRKLVEFSKNLTNKMASLRAQQQQQAGGSNEAGKGQQPQPQPSQTQPQAQAQSGENNAPNPNPNLNQGQQAKPSGPQPSQKIIDHVDNFPYVLLQQIGPDTPDAAKWLESVKAKYKSGLATMEHANGRIQQLNAFLQKRNAEGKPLSPEEDKDFKQKKAQYEKSHADAKNFVESFRQQQFSQKQANGQKVQQQGEGNAGTSQQPPTRPQLNPQQRPPNPALQNSQSVNANAAIEAARNQQQMVNRPPMQANGQMPGQAQGGSVQNIKTEGGIPAPINTAVQQMQQANRPGQTNSPQSAIPQSSVSQSANAQNKGPPRPLTHSAAMQQAARSYSHNSVQQTTDTPNAPNVIGHSHPVQQREPQNTITNKMPIPKHLPERATATPQPVPYPQSRPTYTGGPGNIGNGVVNQPVMSKQPGYSVDGEGERILNKKKLDELVRQVTGGGEGLENGEALSADVEESILSVADNFVDQVLHSACAIAKERGSKVLEIRDIQLTLERGYNIRIPGYASDEIRTVRKIQPAPAWISKMSAVQASKVTGGKGGD